jgi:cytochrome c nitrite reductase small subunit
MYRRRAAAITGFGLFVAASAGIVFGMGIFTFNYAEGTSYLSNDPAACLNCHIMRDQFDGWRKSTHHASATCNDCHVPHDLIGKYWTKFEHGLRHSKGFTFQDFQEPIQIKRSSLKIVEHNCVHCHQSLVAELPSHGEAVDCAQCHRGIGHGARH